MLAGRSCCWQQNDDDNDDGKRAQTSANRRWQALQSSDVSRNIRKLSAVPLYKELKNNSEKRDGRGKVIGNVLVKAGKKSVEGH